MIQTIPARTVQVCDFCPWEVDFLTKCLVCGKDGFAQERRLAQKRGRLHKNAGMAEGSAFRKGAGHE